MRRAPQPAPGPFLWRTAVLAAAATALAGWACGGGAARTPLAEPTAVARAVRSEAPRGAWRVTLDWQYADARGPVRGEGVLRYTAPDSLRLDLLGPGEGSIAASLVGDRLRSVGQIGDVRLPPPPFLHAAAGLFRPGSDRPDRGWRESGDRVLLYRLAETELVFRLESDRLVRLEERRGDRTVRRLDLTWPDSSGASPWPRSAEYRDRARESRARWTVQRARPAERSFPPEIYDLSTPSP